MAHLWVIERLEGSRWIVEEDSTFCRKSWAVAAFNYETKDSIHKWRLVKYIRTKRGTSNG